MSSTRYSCQIVLKLEFYRQIFEKSSNTKFRENPSGEEANSRFSKFCERA